MYIGKPLKNYIEDVAARKPAPGGGSAAACCGALGTALLEMVCNFSIGDDVKKVLLSLEGIRKEFSALIDKDVEVYSAIRSAFKSKDKKTIDKALEDGYDVSLKVCKLSIDALKRAEVLTGKGNVNLITDVGCGAELLNAAFNCGIFNAEINLKGIEDKEFTQKQRAILGSLKKDMVLLYKNAITKTKERMR